MTWIIELESASPDDEFGLVLRESLERCLYQLRKNHAVGSCDEGGWKIEFTVEAADAREAWDIANGSNVPGDIRK